MTRFVIDEVVLHNAHNGKNSHGDIDLDASIFFLNFCTSNHNLALNLKIEKKYHELSSKFDGKKIMLNVPSLIHKLLLDKKRVDYFERSSFEFVGPKKCDVEFVRVTKESNGYLVTEDAPLIDVIKNKGLADLIKIKRTKEALILVTNS